MSFKLIIILLLTGLCGTAFGGQTVYVDAGAPSGGDGASWAGAFRFLQNALWTADPCDQIWVAEGLYQPDRYGADPCGTGNWTATFQLVDGVEIYGGFPAGGGDWDSRDPCIYETVLSGDLTGNDVEVADPCDLPAEPNLADNCYHVLSCDGAGDNTILDGVTITGGNANGYFPHNIGGGMYNVDTDIIIRQCCFRGNTALYAAGMRNLSGSPTIEDCTFSGNACQKVGGGLYNHDSSPTISRCTFSNNWGRYAAGMYIYNVSSPILTETLTDCVFQDNVAVLDGGGLNIYNASDPNITRCTFSGNRAGQTGGGIWDGGTGTLSDCEFSDNWAGEQGGGMFIDKSSATVLTRCNFDGNSTDADGGGMYCHSESVSQLVNCTFSLNQAVQNGGGIAGGGTGTLSSCLFSENIAANGGGLHNDSSSVTIQYCTFSANTADAGGGIYHDGGVSEVRNCTLIDNAADNGNALACVISTDEPNDLLVINSILWNGGDEVWHDDKAVFTITYCDVQGGWSGVGVGVGNIDIDPCFVEPGYWDDPCDTPADPCDDVWVQGDYHLRSQAGRWDSLIYRSADFQGDGIVNLIDFAEFSRYWLMVVDDYLPYDLDRSGIVDIGDLYLFIEQYLTAGDGYWICDSVTSRCIDAGNPGSQLTYEPSDGVNVRVNMGAYGATSEASKTPAGWSLLPDLNNDRLVDIADLIIQIEDWLDSAEEQPGDLNRDGRVDLSDVAILAEDWLEY